MFSTLWSHATLRQDKSLRINQKSYNKLMFKSPYINLQRKLQASLKCDRLNNIRTNCMAGEISASGTVPIRL